MVEGVRTKAGTLDLLHELLGDDHVGVDILPIERRHKSGIQLLRTPASARVSVDGKKRHRASGQAADVKEIPSIAAAAAIAGLTRWVRPPAPWRPPKLRFVEAAERSPGSSRSAFIARHIEHPGSRHSKPAARNILSRPLAFGLGLQEARPRHDHREADVRRMRRPSVFTT